MTSHMQKGERPSVMHIPQPNQAHRQYRSHCCRLQHQSELVKKINNYRIVICLLRWAPLLPTPPSRDAEAVVPGLRSKTFQNFRLSSAAAQRTTCQYSVGSSCEWKKGGRNLPVVANICPSGLRQLCSTRVSWAGISTLRTRVG